MIGEEIASPEQLSCKVNETRVLKEAIIGQLQRNLSFVATRVTYSERVVKILQNVLFVFDMINVLRIYYLKFLHRLNRVLFFWITLKPTDFNISEST